VRAAACAHGDDPQPAYSTTVAAVADDEFAGYVDSLLADTREGTSRPAGYVPFTHLWWVERERFFGRVHIRHRLTPFLRQVDGHLGITSRRPKAVAVTRPPCSQVPVPVPAAAAVAVGIACLLLTCDADNVGSARSSTLTACCCRTSAVTSSASGVPTT